VVHSSSEAASGAANSFVAQATQDAKRAAARILVRPGATTFLASSILRLQRLTKKKRVEKLRYIHRNPVRRGLVETPDQWRWSSFRAYAYGETGAVRMNDWSVLKMKIREGVTFGSEKPRTA
jgi:putative transposase